MDSRKHLILLAGASCAGKTTTSIKIDEEIEKSGGHAETISLDDFYLNPDEKPKLKDGIPDYESPECLDLPLLRHTFDSISERKPTRLPVFDFKKRRRLDEWRLITPDEHTFIVVEGLHALNPEIIGEESHSNSYRIYLNCESPAYDAKLLRRLVRDNNYRNASAEVTFSLWDNVKNGEMKYIFPFKPISDTVINTFFEYELSALKSEGVAVLEKVDKGSIYYAKAEYLLNLLSAVDPLDKKLIPPSSLLWEFLKTD
ncbi:MAG: uridine kinase family protein [Eubacteriales bacterium]